MPIEISEKLQFGSNYEITIMARPKEEIEQILIDMANWEAKQAVEKNAAQTLVDQMRK